MPRAVLTFDVEEDYHGVEGCSPDRYGDFPERLPDLVPRLLNLLDRHDARATFFVLGRVARRHPDLVRTMRDRGHEIGSHGHRHRAYSELSRSDIERDVNRSKRALVEAGIKDVTGFRAPFFSVYRRDMEWFSAVLEQAGFTYDASLIGAGHPAFGERGAPGKPERMGSVVEVPVPDQSLLGWPCPMGGSFGFRALPVPALRWLLGRHEAVSDTVPVLYFHPWELEPGSWRLWWAAGPRAKFVHFWGRRNLERKLTRLLEACEMMSVRRYLEETGLIPVD